MTTYRILGADLDGTLLGKPDATLAFRYAWTDLSDARRPLLCYLTGRALDDALETIQESDLPDPDYLISGSGTTVYDYRNGQVLKAFSDIFDETWDLDRVDAVLARQGQLRKRAAHHQGRYKTTWHGPDLTEAKIAELEHQLEAEGLDVVLLWYPDHRNVDVIPRHADKGNAMRWLLKQLGLNGEQCIVAGDAGSDSGLFFIPGVTGIIVRNAQPELFEATVKLSVYEAESVCADGVIEGLVHYGVLEDLPFLESVHPSLRQLGPKIQHLVDEGFAETLSSDQIDYLRTAYCKALEALRRNITPLGFSACSLNDNVTVGVAENYRSVWARDGAICVQGTLSVDAPDVRQCQIATLRTLLDATTPNGQVPANVRIDSGVPDYSGLGNICSIDSGLWTVIAFSEFVRTTRNMDLLREYQGTLHRIMSWLDAHDANHDFLLEIPEASDWTDLFGRSYNVLYDEVLWYHANFCYGRLLEQQGKHRRAGEYFRRARMIRAAILRQFWPSSHLHDEDSILNFAELQYSLGETQYLLAQVTPFDFNWRCDIYGNILACLFNVLDIERARGAFRFMWGVGINTPYPVANLYPAVTPGDRDWRSYYTVNLLNLPQHYHNGGIWPFIGAQWVRFINRLGMRDIALHELIKVAQLNQLGVLHDWEFNEWAHGTTGHPMGKAFQAWSASEFVSACNTLRIDRLC